MHSLPAFVIKQTVWMSLLSGHSVGKSRQSNGQRKERHKILFFWGGFLTSSLCVVLFALLSPLKPLSDMNSLTCFLSSLLMEGVFWIYNITTQESSSLQLPRESEQHRYERGLCASLLPLSLQFGGEEKCNIKRRFLKRNTNIAKCHHFYMTTRPSLLSSSFLLTMLILPVSHISAVSHLSCQFPFLFLFITSPTVSPLLHFSWSCGLQQWRKRLIFFPLWCSSVLVTQSCLWITEFPSSFL